MTNNIEAKWIWPAGVAGINRYAEFRREFELADIETAKLEVSSDTNFVAWINGKFVGAGQFADYPDSKTFSTIDITASLKPGRNVLAVLVHYCGVGHFSYIPGDAGLWFNLNTADGNLTSDSETVCRYSLSYKTDKVVKITPQMGFTFEYDASVEDDWRGVEYICDGTWQPSVEREKSIPPIPRPLPMLLCKSRPDSKIIAQGLFRRSVGKDTSIAEMMQTDFLSARRSWELFYERPQNINPSSLAVTVLPTTVEAEAADGFYIIYDLGREECGLVDIELHSPAGVVVDIAVGEHLDDLRVRSRVGIRNFVSRYITRDGKNTFTHYTNRYAGRYVQLHLSKITGPVKVAYAGLIPTDYPVKFRGAFESSDSLHVKIFETARRTMHLCMHEHYEDCPWREQALYANDSRNQALAGYYAFGEYEFSQVCLELLGKSFSQDGYQELCAPMKFDFTIPSFSMVWYMAMDDFLLYSGNVSAVEQAISQMVEVLGIYEQQLVDDVLPSPKGKRYWQFYDWADGLFGGNVRPDDGGLTGRRFDAPLNFMYVLALRAMGRMARACGRDDFAVSCELQANATSAATFELFWDKSEQAYCTYVGEQAELKHFAELTQSLALLCGGGEAQREQNLRLRLAKNDNGLVSTTLSQSLYKFEALMQQPALFGGKVFANIREDWGRMLYTGATSFWETLRGGWDFGCAGSLCHGWSGIPAYFYGAYALGVKPLENGFKVFTVSPVVEAFANSGGIVHTPSGDIEISWERAAGKISGTLKHPAGITPKFAENIDPPKWKITVAD